MTRPIATRNKPSESGSGYSPVETMLPDARTTTGRRQPSTAGRAFTARSVIASTLLGTTPPRLPAATLLRSCALFSISPATARTALARMVAAGELETEDGRYILVGRLRQRQDRQVESRRGDVAPVWDGTWVVYVVSRDSRDPAERSRLRSAMYRLRTNELYPGSWTRPDNLVSTAGDAEETVRAQCLVFRGATPEDPSALAGRLWDLDGWAAEAAGLIATMRSTQSTLRLDDQVGLAGAFSLNASVLRLLQADPFLPAQLVPAGWPAPELRATFESFDRSFASAWRGWLRN